MKLYVALFVLSTFAFPSHAARMVYTFAGEIVRFSDEAGAFATSGLAVGDSVLYQFIIDFDAQGSVTYNDGSVVQPPDVCDPPQIDGVCDYFYTQLLTSNYLREIDGGSHNAPDDIGSIRIGEERTSTEGWAGVTLFGGSADALVYAFATDCGSCLIESIVLGTRFSGFDRVFDNMGKYSLFQADLELMDISVVPIPAAVWLFATALSLIGLIAHERRLHERGR